MRNEFHSLHGVVRRRLTYVSERTAVARSVCTYPNQSHRSRIAPWTLKIQQRRRKSFLIFQGSRVLYKQSDVCWRQSHRTHIVLSGNFHSCESCDTYYSFISPTNTAFRSLGVSNNFSEDADEIEFENSIWGKALRSDELNLFLANMSEQAVANCRFA